MRGKSVALLCSSVDIQLSFCDLYLDINSGALHISYDSDDLMGVLEAESGVTIAIGHLTDALDQMINNTCASVGAQTDTPQEDQHAQNAP